MGMNYLTIPFDIVVILNYANILYTHIVKSN